MGWGSKKPSTESGEHSAPLLSWAIRGWLLKEGGKGWGIRAREGDVVPSPPLPEGSGEEDGYRGTGHSSSKLESP